MKKKQSKPGIISATLSLIPSILAGLYFVGILDAIESPALALITFGTIPILGIVLGIIGLLLKTKSRVLPVIGITINIIWLGYLIWGLYKLQGVYLGDP
jgi:hypothetical protein